MSELSFFSTLQDIITLSDTELRNGIGSLSPNVVTDYVFYLRRELAKAQDDWALVSRENYRLQGITEELRGENNRLQSIIERLRQSSHDLRLPTPSDNKNVAKSSTSDLHFNNRPISTGLPDSFPNVSGSIWVWAPDGKRPIGTIEFVQDGTVRWCHGAPHGYWKLKESGSLLETYFNGTFHEIEYAADSKQAYMRTPSGHSARMWVRSKRTAL